MVRFDWRKRGATMAVVPLTAVSLIAAVPFGLNAFAAGGTAKPPPGAVAPFVTATLPDPVISVNPATIHGFDDTGFIQGATVDTTNANCPNTPADQPSRFGGTLTLNHGPIVIPCNLVIQLPANTMTWADFVKGPAAPDLSLGSLALGGAAPSFEMSAVGNLVGGRRIAALLYASQQSLNGSTGIITAIDYATGDLKVDTGDGAKPAIVQINDPKGRFGRAQSPDPRFSVDDANPTIHAGTGYPMCVPRTDPATADDALCPQANRPKPSASGQCRNFSVAGIALPVSGELTASVGLPYCSQFVMPSVAGRSATDPDPRQQAPFEVGDAITFSGTLIPATSSAPEYISAHTIEANLGIYTMPNTQPSYLAIGDFGVGSADPSAVSINGFAVETQDRIFLESETTDVKTPVDIYMQDVNPVTGEIRNRWVTPFAMTGEQNGPLQADGVTPIGGGITTQNAGPQPQRARLRATKAPIGLLSQPTRTVRVAVRSLCVPQAPVNDAAGNPVLTSLDTCLNKSDSTNQVANGLAAGQYFAPTFEFIFPENVKPGDLLVPFDFWHLPFLRYGEGATTQSDIGPAVGPLEPTPWGGPSANVPGAPTIGTATAGDAAATVTWTPPTSDGGAPITGYTVTALDGSNVVGTLTVAGNVTTATITGLTNGTAVTLKVVATNAVGTSPASAASNAVTPSAPASAASAVSLSPASLTGGAASTGTVTLTSPAPVGDAVVTLTSSDISATVPASVTVAAGATSATFAISTSSVTASKTATITATYGGATASAALTLTPAIPLTSLSTVSVNPTTVTAGAASQGTVLLSTVAPTGGWTVALTSSSAAATVPANVTVAAGALIATFPITTSSVTTSTSATITANDGAVTRTATLTVTPPATSALTVTATGRAGERITSTPTGINVTVGSTGTASFPTGTSITLAATNNRDVIWSGACSSGGAKAKTCTFTINANAAVTGSVQ
ncbi:MAG: fibronectin type III domain-containing protein [Dermatophilaceae bacterium]